MDIAVKQATARVWPYMLVMLAIAIAERALWAVIRSDAAVSNGEAFMVARALADGRGFADAYQVGQGPTAHLLPISPAIAGAVFYLFGSESVAAKAVLSTWSIGCALGSYLLFYRALGTMGMAQAGRIAALGVLCLVPVYIGQEAIDFRAWEGALTVLLGAAYLDRAAIADRDGLDWPRAIVLAVLATVGFFVNPVYGVGLYAGGLILAWRQWPIGRLAMLLLVCAIMLGLLVGPWTLRNARALGYPVILRSNSGLELALSNRPDAVDGVDQGERYYAHLNTIHPHSSVAAYERLRAVGGEVRYARMLGDTTKAWMLAHPLDVARLMVRHVMQLYAPPPWVISQPGSGLSGFSKSLVASCVGLLGLLGLAWRLRSGLTIWWVAGCLILVPGLLVSPFQPVARYCYLIFALCAFFAADFVQRAIALWRARSASPS